MVRTALEKLYDVGCAAHLADLFHLNWICCVTGCRYFSNIGVVLLNKYLLSFYGFKWVTSRLAWNFWATWVRRVPHHYWLQLNSVYVYDCRFPVFLTLCHMVACTILSYMVSMSGMVPRQGVKSKQQFFKISALALVFCGSVVCGNISLRYLPVSFNQAVGATTPFFTAIFSAVMLGMEPLPKVPKAPLEVFSECRLRSPSPISRLWNQQSEILICAFI